jgi:uroporphyrinogen-III synthase
MTKAVKANNSKSAEPKATSAAKHPREDKAKPKAAAPKKAVTKKDRQPVAAKAKKPAAAAAASEPLVKKVRSILVTQPKPEGDKSPYFDLARKYNLELEFHPFIRVEGVSGRDFRRQRVDVNDYSAIVFTSRSAVDHFFRIMEEMKVKVSQEMKYCCVTEAVALYLQKFILYRKRKVFFSADGSTQGLLDVIGKHKAEKYVLPASESGKNEINNYLSKHSIPYAEVTLFHTVSNDISPVMKKNAFDMIVFFSPFSVQTLFAHEPKFRQNGMLVGAFGPTTSKAVEEAGLRLDVKAPAPNAPSMVSALEQYLAVSNK